MKSCQYYNGKDFGVGWEKRKELDLTHFMLEIDHAAKFAEQY